MAQTKSKPSWRRIIFLAGGLVLLLLPPVAIFSFELAWQNRVYPGVKVGTIDLGGLTQTQTENKLAKVITAFSSPLSFKYDDHTWSTSLDQLGVEFQPKKTSLAALQAGRRQAGFFPNWREKILYFRGQKSLPLDFVWEEEKKDQFLASTSAQINQPSIPTTLKWEKGQLIAQKGKPGRRVLKKGLANLVKAALARASLGQTIKVPVAVTNLLPSDERINETIARGEKFKGKSIIFTDTSINLVVEADQLINFLDFAGGYRQEEIKAWIETIKESVNQPAQNASFQFDSGRVTVFSPAKTGYRLDEAQTNKQIISALRQLETSAKEKLILALKIDSLEPEVKTSDSNQFGISGLVGKGESWFFHSIATRVSNVALASSKFNGILVKPGEEFSFNKILGEVSGKTGYQPAWVIKGGRTILGDGGGVCQVSTTMFRAALNAGLPITERRAHSYRVGYYEYNSILGMDATVFAPSVDFKFKNDYPCHLLIQTVIDKKGRYLAFEIYGCPDQRKVVISNDKVWGIVPPPEPQYIDDPTLPPGVVKQVDFPAWGSKASFDWTVTRKGEVLQQKTFYSAYRPWQAIYRRGVGGG